MMLVKIAFLILLGFLLALAAGLTIRSAAKRRFRYDSEPDEASLEKGRRELEGGPGEGSDAS